MKTSRRNFIKTAMAAAAAAVSPEIIHAAVLGRNGAIPPSDRAAIALISCGDRSGVSIEYKEYAKSEVVAVCDPIRERRLQKKAMFGGCPDYSDFREVLARKDVDAVHISTPDHWHVPVSLAAARAGKDMYTEKPLGLTIEQVLAAREITAKHNRVFQYGTQNRSIIQVRSGIELVLNGHIGEVKEAYVWCPQGESGGSATPVMPVPEGFDYQMWLGPAPEAPFCRDRCLVQGPRNGIYHIYDYAIGFIAGWGAHPMDQMQWWADNAGLTIPVKYKGNGTIPKEGLFNTVTHWDVACTYANGFRMRFTDDVTARETKNIPHIDEMKFEHGTLFEGTEGWVAVSRNAWQVYPESLYRKAKDPGSKRLTASASHTGNFVDCVLERKQPIAPLESAMISDLICHLSQISIRTGRSITWDPAKETIVGDSEAAKMMKREMRGEWTL